MHNYYRGLLAVANGAIQDSTKYFKSHPDATKIVYQRISKNYGIELNTQYLQGQIDVLSTDAGAVRKTYVAVGEKRWKIKDRPILRQAWKYARKTGYPIEAADLTRLFGNRSPHQHPSQKMMNRFLKQYPGVIFLVKIPYGKVKSWRTVTGQKNTGDKGGRPKTHKSMTAWQELKGAQIEKAQQYRNKGTSYSAIAKKLKRSSRTIWKWLKYVP